VAFADDVETQNKKARSEDEPIERSYASRSKLCKYDHTLCLAHILGASKGLSLRR